MIVNGKKKESTLLEILNEIKEYDAAMINNPEFSKEYRDGVHHAFQIALKIVENKNEKLAMR